MRRLQLLRSARRNIISGPQFTPIVQALPSMVPFVAPEEMERVRGRKYAVRLGANESTFGPSPLAVSAMQEAVADCWMYGDPKSHDLRTALAAHFGLDMMNFVVGEGIDGLLNTTAGLLVGPGDSLPPRPRRWAGVRHVEEGRHRRHRQ